MLDTTLIERALDLCGKTLKDIENTSYPTLEGYEIEKLCYYLLSPAFILIYIHIDDIRISEGKYLFGDAIYEYQYGNEEPLEGLLSKI